MTQDTRLFVLDKIGHRAFVFAMQVWACLVFGGVAVLTDRPMQLAMQPAAYPSTIPTPPAHHAAEPMSGWWALAILAAMAYLLGAAVASIVTGRLVWPLNWLAAFALRDAELVEPARCEYGWLIEAHDDPITPLDHPHDCARAER